MSPLGIVFWVLLVLKISGIGAFSWWWLLLPPAAWCAFVGLQYWLASPFEREVLLLWLHGKK